MKILPIIGTKIKPANVFRRLSQRLRFTESYDTVEFSQTKNSIEGLTLSTFKKLKETNYKPSKLKGYYSTFVIDKSTGKPVTVFVKQTQKNQKNGYEKFDFYVKSKEGKNLEHIGNRSFYVRDKSDVLFPGYMISTKNDKYLGVGIREEQIAFERMEQTGAPNIMINPTADAEPFHKGCGFEWNTNWAGRMTLTPKALEEWREFINSGQRIIK